MKKKWLKRGVKQILVGEQVWRSSLKLALRNFLVSSWSLAGASSGSADVLPSRRGGSCVRWGHPAGDAGDVLGAGIETCSTAAIGADTGCGMTAEIFNLWVFPGIKSFMCWNIRKQHIQVYRVDFYTLGKNGPVTYNLPNSSVSSNHYFINYLGFFYLHVVFKK